MIAPETKREQAEQIYSVLKDYAHEIGKDGVVFDNPDFRKSALAFLESRLNAIEIHTALQSKNASLRRTCEIIQGTDPKHLNPRFLSYCQ